MKRFAYVSSALLAVLALAGCGKEKVSSTSASSSTHVHHYVEGVCPDDGAYEVPFLHSLPMSQKLQAANEKQGTVEDFDYTTYLYDVDGKKGESTPKKAQVYLPYGYDASKNYNVLYLMHGGGDTYTYWMTDMGATTRNVLDNLFAAKKADPCIVVCPTFYTPLPEKKKPEVQKTAQAEEKGNPIAEQAMNLTDVFQYEFRNDLVPAIEAHYATYAKADTSEKGLIATRDHRGYAGLSMGSITSIHSILMGCLDICSYIGSFSGGYGADKSTTVADYQKIHDTVEQKFSSYDCKYWYNQNGSADIALEPHEKLKELVLSKWSDRFNNGKNYAWIKFNGGTHAYNCWVQGMYNVLLVFFKK